MPNHIPYHITVVITNIKKQKHRLFKPKKHYFNVNVNGNANSYLVTRKSQITQKVANKNRKNPIKEITLLAEY